MTRRTALLTLCASAFAAIVLVAQSRVESWQGYYVSSAPPPGALAATAEADVFAAYEGQALYIDFKISSRDGVVLGAVGSGHNLTTTQFTFSFTDGAGKRGSGVFRRVDNGVVLRLERTEPTPASTPIDALYGEYLLRIRDAHWRTDRHPWSLDRNQPSPPR